MGRRRERDDRVTEKKYTKITVIQNMRERTERQTDGCWRVGASERASESNRKKLKSQLSKLVLRCSRVVCVRLEEH